MARVPLLSDADAWAALPEAEGETGWPLPAWALALAGTLPRTTAAMLEVEYVQRVRSPLHPKLRAQVRWVAARANRCSCGERYALDDLRRAGGEADLEPLRGDWKNLSEPHRLALEFADKLTRHAYRITDEEVAALRAHHGDANVVALVQCVAYANYQDRLVLSLGLGVEEGGPRRPAEVRFRKPYQGGKAVPPRRPPADAPAVSATTAEPLRLNFNAARAATEAQKERSPRIPVPSPEEVRRRLPPGAPERFLRINWSRVCVGYQPELALAWSNGLRTFEEEAKQDRVFEESLFWIVTQALQCHY
jgi:alkylhydroperoxidase family enzyme